MKVKELRFEDYPHRNVLILTPKNFKFNRGATFPPDCDAKVVEIYGEQEIDGEHGAYSDEEGVFLTICLKNEFYPYGTKK